jgi:flagellar hook-length control protein FliK
MVPIDTSVPAQGGQALTSASGRDGGTGLLGGLFGIFFNSALGGAPGTTGDSGPAALAEAVTARGERETEGVTKLLSPGAGPGNGPKKGPESEDEKSPGSAEATETLPEQAAAQAGAANVFSLLGGLAEPGSKASEAAEAVAQGDGLNTEPVPPAARGTHKQPGDAMKAGDTTRPAQAAVNIKEGGGEAGPEGKTSKAGGAGIEARAETAGHAEGKDTASGMNKPAAAGRAALSEGQVSGKTAGKSEDGATAKGSAADGQKSSMGQAQSSEAEPKTKGPVDQKHELKPAASGHDKAGEPSGKGQPDAASSRFQEQLTGQLKVSRHAEASSGEGKPASAGADAATMTRARENGDERQVINSFNRNPAHGAREGLPQANAQDGRQAASREAGSTGGDFRESLKPLADSAPTSAGQMPSHADMKAAPLSPRDAPPPASQQPSARVFNLNDHVFVVTRRDDSSMEVSLKPEGLGKLHLEVNLDRGVINAHIHASDPGGKETIERNLQGILNALSREGFNVGGFSVALRGGRGSGGRGARAPEGSEKVDGAVPAGQLTIPAKGTVPFFAKGARSISIYA